MKKDVKTTILIIVFVFGVLGFSSVKSRVSEKLTNYSSFVSSKAQVGFSY